MKVNHTARDSAFYANLYRACDGQYTRTRSINREAVVKSPYHKVQINDTSLDVELDKDAEDYEEMFNTKGVAISPDELLEIAKPGSVKIPVKYRDEFEPDMQLPPSELLEVLHYFTSKKFSKTKSMQKVLDESALLAFGMLVEQWIDEAVDEHTARMFVNDAEIDEEEEENEASDENEEVKSQNKKVNGDVNEAEETGDREHESDGESVQYISDDSS